MYKTVVLFLYKVNATLIFTIIYGPYINTNGNIYIYQIATKSVMVFGFFLFFVVFFFCEC